MTSTIAGNLDGVDQRLRQACERAGRLRETITLVAVTKFQSSESVRALAAAGVGHFAESRVQEAQTKVPGLKSLGTWHFIGHLQTNKARQAVELFDVIQSVDSLRLAGKLDEVSADLGRRLRVFAQVNCSGEAQKQGFSLESAAHGAVELAKMPHLKLEGLMGMAPQSDPDAVRLSFRRLRQLREVLAPDLGPLLLSMGMSGDFEAAVEEGADLVRIGSALFP
jgi:pyridoxal phosphate enzyme (YggS family)